MRILIVAASLVLAVSPPAIAGPPSKTLERAIKLYDKEDFFSATIELSKVIAGETGDDAVNVRRAEFFQAKTFARLNFHAAAQTMFMHIVDRAPAHEYRIITAKWLVAELDAIPSAVARELLALYDDAAVNDPSLDDRVRAAMVYARGRRAAEQNSADAKQILSHIPAGSEFWSQGQLQLADIEFRTRQLDAGIEAAAKAARDPATAIAAVRMLAFWPRMLGKPAASRDVLTALATGDTPSAGLAKLELSRLALEAGGAVPGLAPIPAPTFDAVVLAAVCPGQTTDDVIAAAIKTTRASASGIAELLQHYEDSIDLYMAVTPRLAAPGTALDRVMRQVLSDPATTEVLAWPAEMTHELDLLMHTDKAWQTTMVAADILAETTVQQSVAIADAGKVIRDRLDLAARDLRTLLAALEPVHARLAAGPEVAPGGGLVVTAALCNATLGTAVPEIATSAPVPVAPVTPPRAHGCAGCATGGDGGLATLAALAAAFALATRRRRPVM